MHHTHGALAGPRRNRSQSLGYGCLHGKYLSVSTKAIKQPIKAVLSISVFLYTTTRTLCTCTYARTPAGGGREHGKLSHKYLEARLPSPLQEAFRAVALSKAA